MKAKKPSRLGRAIAEMATDQRQVGVISDAACRKITLHHLGTKPAGVSSPSADAKSETLLNREPPQHAIVCGTMFTSRKA